MSIQELFGPIAANDNEANCVHCGAPFTPKHGRRFCTDECRRADYNAKRRGDKVARLANAPEHVCEHCGVTFRRRKDKKNAARFCSRECGFAAKSNLRAEQRVSPELREAASVFAVSYSVARCVCVQCGVRFIGSSLADRYCSEACEEQYKRARYIAWNDNGRDRSPRPCSTCGVVFTPEYGDRRRKFCSSECNAKSEAAKASRKAAKMRRRCAVVEAVDPLIVFDRDGWRCQLCGIRTPKRLRGTYDDRAPELDHIMPISLGGEHSYRNTQCSCRKCNAAKSNTPLGQFRLFG